jgi:hypothetical protein
MLTYTDLSAEQIMFHFLWVSLEKTREYRLIFIARMLSSIVFSNRTGTKSERSEKIIDLCLHTLRGNLDRPVFILEGEFQDRCSCRELKRFQDWATFVSKGAYLQTRLTYNSGHDKSKSSFVETKIARISHKRYGEYQERKRERERESRRRHIIPILYKRI